jgi:glycyl-tRNA synthetase beta chain
MSQSASYADLLIEIGMEELPPKLLKGLVADFAGGMSDALGEARLAFGVSEAPDSQRAGGSGIEAFGAPRRIAVIVRGLSLHQPDETVEMRGPPVRVAFDADGEPTRAAQAFAAKCGVEVADLGRVSTDKGEWLVHMALDRGSPAAALLPELVDRVVRGLTIPRRMRWGDREDSFIRPIHWYVLIHGDQVVDGSLFGTPSGRCSRGHRFHAPGEIRLASAGEYAGALREHFVIADFAERRQRVVNEVAAAAAEVGGRVLPDDELLDEVTALCDWPVAVTGSFDPRFLALPWEVLDSTLKVHQRYFPIVDDSGNATSRFVTIANIESRDPDAVRLGNERVVKPRLEDADFFWNQDRAKPLAARVEALDRVVYQRQLGSIGDKSSRVRLLAQSLAVEVGADEDTVRRAAELARADLLTDMVGEFPELQGIMGAYYAREDGETAATVAAIRDQYKPGFAGDEIPETVAGRVLSIADRLDTIAGIFAIGKRPSGTRDPFGIRRAALGLLRIGIEGELDFDLMARIGEAIDLQPVPAGEHPELAEDVYDYVMERLRGYYQGSLCAERGDLFDAVLARTPHSPLDFDKRLRSVARFVNLPESGELAAANKRIVNLLRGAGTDAGATLDPDRFEEPGERGLFAALSELQEATRAPLAAGDYETALLSLAALRGPVDAFFDEVMVMTEDVAQRRNRIALLAEVRGLFLEVADISELDGGRE